MPSLTFDIITIFPGFFVGPLDFGIVNQGRKRGIVEIQIHDLRTFATDRHKTVDDRPFGGGEGMVLKPEPLFKAVEDIYSRRPNLVRKVVLLSPQGKRLDQALASSLSCLAQITLICGRYEGVDERVVEYLATDEVSIGDYVLSGGELAACVLVDSVTRLIPGVLHNDTSALKESFVSANHPGESGYNDRLLDCPHYTRPEVFEGIRVPEILLSGHHAKVELWRRKKALEKTLKNRPDLLQYAGLSDFDRNLLETEIKL
jgi:tRNA (guanine37-N1)-methyltransferase